MQKTRRVLLLLLILSFATTASAQVVQEPLPEQPVAQKKSSLGTIVAVGLVAVAGGVGGYLLFKQGKKVRAHADSVIAVVESAWKSASDLYAGEEYRAAILRLQEITTVWYDYENSVKKYRRLHSIDPDSIRAVIVSCNFLEGMIPEVKKLSIYAESLPDDEFGLTKLTRHTLTARMNHLRTSLDSIIAAYPNHQSGLRYSFRHIERQMHTTDSLIDAAYIQRKTDFEVKNRFHYKRAIEANTSAALELFVADCDYFRVDKEWCHRARMALSGSDGAVSNGIYPNDRMSVQDSIQFSFDRAISSNKIEDLEAYIAKYSNRHYRKYSQYTRLKEAAAALRLLSEQVRQNIEFNKKYPRLDARNVGDITLTIQGLSGTARKVFLDVWQSLERDVVRLPKVRMPASLIIDYSKEAPVIQLEMVVDPLTDIERTTVNGRAAYRIECLVPAVTLLNNLKRGVLKTFAEDPSSSSDSKILQYLLKKVAYAAYTVRINKPDGKGFIMLYAKEKQDRVESENAIEFYEFYDIAVTGSSATRFPIYPTSLPTIIPSLSSDSLEQKMGTIFFTGQ